MIQDEFFQGIVVDAFKEDETGGLLRVQDQPGLHRKANLGSLARTYLKIQSKQEYTAQW